MSRKIRLFSLMIVAALLLGAVGMTRVSAQDTPERRKIEVEAGGKPLDVIKQLRELELADSGGEIGLQLRSSFVESRQEGYTYLPIGRGTELKNFVLQFELRIADTDGETNGCGMYFRIDDEDNYGVVVLRWDRSMLLYQENRGEAVAEFDAVLDDLDNLDTSDFEIDFRTVHILTLVALDKNLVLFLNGTEIATFEESVADRGTFAIVVYNEEGNSKNTLCRYSNIWAWSYDN